MSHARRLNSILDNMMIYGFLLGGAAGLATGITLVGLSYSNDAHTLLLESIFWIGGGGMIGSTFGFIIGLISGLFMYGLMKFFHNLLSIAEYRFLSGLATQTIAILTFLPLFLIAPTMELVPVRNNFLFALLFSIGFAIYASQRTVTRYLHATYMDVR